MPKLEFLHSKQVDLNTIALPATQALAPKTIVIGDLHGNALKLFHFLISEGKLTNTTNEAYEQFKNIYNKNIDELNLDDLDTFETLLDSLDINHNINTILIGDELADRGENDYFTLKILAKICRIKGTTILFSNHSAEFILNMQKKRKPRFDRITLGEPQDGFQRSMINFNQLLCRKLISLKDIQKIIQKFYYPNLNLLSTIEFDDALIILTHAPVGLKCIKRVAARLNVPYHDHSAAELKKSITMINQAFDEQYIRGPRSLARVIRRNSQATCSIDAFAWSRNHAQDRPFEYNGFKLYFVHGHDALEADDQHVINLDTDLGKGDHSMQGEYRILNIPEQI